MITVDAVVAPAATAIAASRHGVIIATVISDLRGVSPLSGRSAAEGSVKYSSSGYRHGQLLSIQ